MATGELALVLAASVGSPCILQNTAHALDSFIKK